MKRLLTANPHVWVAFSLACLIAAIVFALSGCAGLRPESSAPITVITFLGTGAPDAHGKIKTTGVIVTIDMTFAPGVQNVGTTYPHEWVDTVPFSHHQTAEKGTVTSYIFKVHPTEPGQSVTCTILFDGNAAKPIDTHTATYPKPAVCSGPPV